MHIEELVHTVVSLKTDDAFRPRLTLSHWQTLESYLVRHEIEPGEVLIRQGDTDCSMYLLEQGTLHVYTGRRQPVGQPLALLRPGAIVGELGLFGDSPRMANVAALTRCVVWALRSPRMEELSQRSPMVARELLRAAGAVAAARIRAHMASNAPIS